MFARRVRAMDHAVPDARVRLRRSGDESAVDVVVPAVVAAGDTAFHDDAELQARAAMRTVAMEQPRAAALVAKQHQFLAEDIERERQVGKIA